MKNERCLTRWATPVREREDVVALQGKANEGETWKKVNNTRRVDWLLLQGKKKSSSEIKKFFQLFCFEMAATELVEEYCWYSRRCRWFSSGDPTTPALTIFWQRVHLAKKPFVSPLLFQRRCYYRWRDFAVLSQWQKTDDISVCYGWFELGTCLLAVVSLTLLDIEGGINLWSLCWYVGRVRETCPLYQTFKLD